jgi:dihydropteroate synthase
MTDPFATILEHVAHIARGCRSVTSHNPAVHEQAIEAAVDEVERQLRGVTLESDERAQKWNAAEARAAAAEQALKLADALADRYGRQYVKDEAFYAYTEARAAVSRHLAALRNLEVAEQVGEPWQIAECRKEAREALGARQEERCPRCEGYEATYHTFKGECSAQRQEGDA